MGSHAAKIRLDKLKKSENDAVVSVYRVVPKNRNWQIETTVWNVAGFLYFFKKPLTTI